MRRLMISLLFAIGASAVSLAAQDTLKELVDLGLSNNSDLQKLYLKLGYAEEDRSGEVSLTQSSLSVSSGYDYMYEDEETAAERPGDSADHSASVSVNLRVPVVPQLTISGGLSYRNSYTSETDTWEEDVDPSGSVSVSVTPFNRFSTYKNEQSYQSALLNLEDTLLNLPYEIVQKVFNLIVAENQLLLAEETNVLREKDYAAVKAQYELDEASYDDLQSALKQRDNARKSEYSANKDVLNQRINLMRILGIRDLEFTLPEIDDSSANQLLAWALAEMDSLSGIPVSTAIKSLQIQLTAAEKQLDDTWVFEPDFSLSGSVQFPFDGVSVSASMSISPSDFNFDERQEMQDALDETKESLEEEMFVLQLEEDTYRKSIDLAARTHEIALLDLQNTKTSYDETVYFYQLGERTDLELEQERITLAAMENSVLSSVMDYFTAVCDLLILYEVNLELP